MAKKVYQLGVRHAETSGNLQKWVDSLYFYNKSANQIRLYGDMAYIFHNQKLITVIKVPENLVPDIVAIRRFKEDKGRRKHESDVYVRKNHDYGDSFSRSFGKYGVTAALVRMEDKWNRLENLAGGAKQRVPDEGLRDTCLDLANYCLMTVMELDRKNGVKKQRIFEDQAKSESAKDHIIVDDLMDRINEVSEDGTVELVIPDKLEREKKSIDEGKVMALYKAKWSQKKIADEMGCSQSRISQIIRAHK